MQIEPSSLQNPFTPCVLSRSQCIPSGPCIGTCGQKSSVSLGSGMQMCFRALHDLPAGEEITQSYFPLHIGYQERQKRLQEDYGLTCTCPRCKVGASSFLQ